MQKRIQAQQHKNFLRTATLLAAMLGLTLLVGYTFMGWEGILWAGLLGGISIVLSYNVPTSMIMRFYRAQPVPAYQLTDLQHIIQQFSQNSGLPRTPKLYYIASHQVNAFATGSKNDPAIAVTYGLLRNLNLKEISGVIAHELSHIINNDIRLQQGALLMNRITRVFSLVGQLLLIFNLSSIMTGEAFFPWWALLILIAAPYLANLLQMALSRTREFDADLLAAKLTGDPNALADALQRLHRMNQQRMNNLQKRLPVWMSTHPHIEDRIQRLRDLAPKFTIRIPPMWI
ncbi:MAG TPA: zinc metalloprotease HtpX [Saprospiraceae bacterium]|nr:zinc metalloprotease HtpX [Saprospiraceae bacterium]